MAVDWGHVSGGPLNALLWTLRAEFDEEAIIIFASAAEVHVNAMSTFDESWRRPEFLHRYQPRRRASFSVRFPSSVRSAHVGEEREIQYRWHPFFAWKVIVRRVEQRVTGQFLKVEGPDCVFREIRAPISRDLRHAFHAILGSHFADAGRLADGASQDIPTVPCMS